MMHTEKYSIYKFIQEGSFPIGIVPIEPGAQHERIFHFHDCSEIAIITSGKGYHILDGVSALVQPGDVLLIHPGNAHAYEHCKTLGMVNVLYDSKRLQLPVLDGESMLLFRNFFPRDRRSLACSAFPFLHLEKETMEVLLQRIQGVHNELLSGNPGSLLYAVALFTEFIVLLSRNGLSGGSVRFDSDKRLANVIEYLNQNFIREINLEELPQRAYMSRRNFYRHFQRMTGCTPLDYIQRRRLLYSMTLLQTTLSPIKEIAQICGFSGSNYFCRRFREMFRISPRQFRIQRQASQNAEKG